MKRTKKSTIQLFESKSQFRYDSLNFPQNLEKYLEIYLMIWSRIKILVIEIYFWISLTTLICSEIAKANHEVYGCKKNQQIQSHAKRKKFGEQNNPVSLILMHMGYGINQFIVKKYFSMMSYADMMCLFCQVKFEDSI